MKPSNFGGGTYRSSGNATAPGAPLIYFTYREVDQRDFFGCEILAKRDLFGSVKDAGIFLGRKKKKKSDFFGYCTFHQLKSIIT